MKEGGREGGELHGSSPPPNFYYRGATPRGVAWSPWCVDSSTFLSSGGFNDTSAQEPPAGFHQGALYKTDAG